LTWLSSAFFLIGGGPLVSVALAVSMIADIAPPERRTTIFLYLTASALVAEMLAPLMAAKLMEKGDWLPLMLALAIQQVGICIAFLFPETLHLRDLPEPKDDDDQTIELQPKGGHFTLKAQLHNFRVAYIFLKSDFQLGLVVFSFLANRLGRQAITLLVRYASKRYDWQIKDAAYLLSFRAAANLVAVAVFLPLVNWFLLKYLRLQPHWADLWLSRGSIILTTVSFFIMGIAAYPALLVFGLLIYNFGTGYNAAMRSVAIHVIGGQASPDVGKLMSTIAIVEAIGAMVAGPLLSEFFQWGMDLGSAWLGLPFLASMVIFAFMTVLTFAISVKDRDVGYMEVQSEDEEDIPAEQGRSSAVDDEAAPRHAL
jgi:MFS family permease